MKKKIICLTFILGVFSGSILAESENGGYAGAFLEMAAVARPAGMGGAYLGVSNDAVAQLYNPAGIAGVDRKTFVSSYRLMKLDRKLGFISLLLPTKLQSALAASWLYAGYGDVAERNGSGQELGATLSSGEHDFGITFAKQFSPSFGLGAKLNYYHKSVGEIKANSVGINLGLLLMVDSIMAYGSMETKPVQDVNIGLVLNHLTAKYPWTGNSEQLTATQDDRFPTTVGIGISCRTFKRDLLLAFDMEKNAKQSGKIKFGGEYAVGNNAFIRSGLNDGVLAAGAGFKFDYSFGEFSFDFAWQAERVGEGSDYIFGFQFLF
jgi:hypothetical protein